MGDQNSPFNLDPVSDDLNPLPVAHRQGLIAVTVFAGLSFASSTTVLLYLALKLVRWHIKTRRHRVKAATHGPATPQVDHCLGLTERMVAGHTPAGKTEKHHPNQFLVLIFNLLLADSHQALAFMMNAVWVHRNKIQVRSPACWAQGWLVQTGDLASSLFITAIAMHTYLAVVRNWTPPHWAVYTTVICLWFFNYLTAVLGIAITNNGKDVGGYFVRASAWCWMNVRYENLRLLLHYLWIFLALALTTILYTLIFLSLRRRDAAASSCTPSPTAANSMTNIRDADTDAGEITPSPSIIKSQLPTTPTTTAAAAPSQPEIHRHGGYHKAFLLYPLIYICCTAPLALGRVAAMAGASVSVVYFCAAGVLITSNGWLDVLLWSVTRHRLLFGAEVDTEESGLDTFAFMRTPPGRRYGNMVWVEGGAAQKRQSASGKSGEMRGEQEGSRPGGWVKRRMGWRPLGLGTGGGAGVEKRRGGSVSGVSLEGGPDGGLAIQMDLVTTVVVEPVGEDEKLWEHRARSRHAPSASVVSRGKKDVNGLDGCAGQEGR
ncbi:hypothetical protein VTI74DRAFT_2549 [Chaetomium olivicolor]